jgi:putative transposase
MCYEHSTTGVFFNEWFEKELVPNLHSGQTISMDNASFHNEKRLRKILDGTVVNLIMLPTYSPDFNPIEKKWANMKRALVDIIPDCKDVSDAVYKYFCVDTF